MTYADAWHQRYEESKYRDVDPVVQAAVGGFAPVDWRTLDWTGRPVRRHGRFRAGNAMSGRQTLALDAMGGSGTLTIRTEVVDAGHVKVQIEDNGPGIAPDDVDRIFDLHFTTRHGRVEFGLGLGLRIARDIVGQHSGSITVASIPGRTTFTVTLPVRQNGERDATVSNAEGETP